MYGSQEGSRKEVSGTHLASESANILMSSHIIGDNDQVTIFEDFSRLSMTTIMTQNRT